MPTRIRLEFPCCLTLALVCVALPLNAIACPGDEHIGDPDAPNRLHLHAADGSRTLHFGPLALLADGEAYRLELPLIDGARLDVALDDRLNRHRAAHEVGLRGSISGTPCPTLPDHLIGRSSENGRIEFDHGWPRHDGSFSASMVFERDGEPILEGEFAEGVVVDITPQELATPGTLYRNDEPTAVEHGVAMYRPDQNGLEVRAVHGWGSRVTRRVPDFTGEPGVFVETSRRRIDGAWVDVSNLHLVHALEDGSLHYEYRLLDPDEHVPDDLSLDVAASMGQRDLLVEDIPVLTLPERPAF